MISWKSYIFSVIVWSLICGILSQMSTDTRSRELLHLVCGISMAVVLLKPFSTVEFEKVLDIPMVTGSEPDIYIKEGTVGASEAQAKSIKAACEEYIVLKANELSLEVDVSVILNDDLLPVFVEIRSSEESEKEKQLEQILSRDLGITKENLRWTWKRESNSS